LRIDSKELRRHYASLSDAELLDLDRDDLVEMAQEVYDQEVARRGLNEPPDEESPAGFDEGAEPDEIEEMPDEADFSTDPGPPPEWLEDATCAHSIAMYPGVNYAEDAARIRTALRAAGIPSYTVVKPPEPVEPARYPDAETCCVMVPGELNMHAMSVIEQKVFNPLSEADFRTHLQALSDEQLRAMKPEIFCGALLDKAARLKRAYQDELDRRKLKTSAR
jgi:hypothetical protein